MEELMVSETSTGKFVVAPVKHAVLIGNTLVRINDEERIIATFEIEQDVEDYIAYRALGPVEELSALVKARDEGRVVALPCKFGGTLYRVRRFTRGENWRKQATFVQPIELTMNNVVKIVFGGELGKTVFLTRVEAESTLEARSEF